MPSTQIIDKLSKTQKESLLKTAKIKTNLPRHFLKQFMERQCNEKNRLEVPGIRENKNIKLSKILGVDKEFKPDNWQSLGWVSEKDYKNFLEKTFLTAFLGTISCFDAPIVFDYKGKDGGNDVFKQVLTTNDIKNEASIDKLKKLPIVSIRGCEFRNYKGNIDNAVLQDIKNSQKEQITQLLKLAKDKGTTDIVFIPYGFGVFLYMLPNLDQEKVKGAILQGIKEAFESCNGLNNKINIHYCGPDDWFENIKPDNYKKLEFISCKGLDAYTMALSLQEEDKKVLLINAADDDFYLKAKPAGQCYRYHTLVDTTADEYYALMTLLPAFSTKNLTDGVLLNSVIDSSYKKNDIIIEDNNMNDDANHELSSKGSIDLSSKNINNEEGKLTLLKNSMKSAIDTISQSTVSNQKTALESQKHLINDAKSEGELLKIHANILNISSARVGKGNSIGRTDLSQNYLSATEKLTFFADLDREKFSMINSVFRGVHKITDSGTTISRSKKIDNITGMVEDVLNVNNEEINKLNEINQKIETEFKLYRQTSWVGRFFRWVFRIKRTPTQAFFTYNTYMDKYKSKTL